VGYGCLLVAPFLLLGGIVTAMSAAGSDRDPNFVMGKVCGAFVPGLLAFGAAAYLLRRGR
jgi:hypothetical protein